MEISRFNFDGHTVRVINDDGILWIPIHDIAEAVGLKNPDGAATHAHKMDIRHFYLGDDNFKVANFHGMTALLQRSPAKNAQKFLDWFWQSIAPAAKNGHK